MGIYLELVDHDAVYENDISPKVIINDIVIRTDSDSNDVNNLLFTRFDNDVLSNVPTCGCGKTHGRRNLHALCPEPSCGTTVEFQFSTKLKSVVWLRAPDRIEGLFNIHVWHVLDQAFTKSGFKLLQWVVDPNYKETTVPHKLLAQVASGLEAAGLRRGYNNFVRNFDEFFKIMFQAMWRHGDKHAQLESLSNYIAFNRSLLLNTYLPLPNKAMTVVSENHMGSYVSTNGVEFVEACRLVIGIDDPAKQRPLSRVEDRVVKFLNAMAKYHNEQFKLYSKKEGPFRRQLYGCRQHFTFRAVISSETRSHESDAIAIPWAIALVVLRKHISGKLLHRGYTMPEILTLLNEHARQTHPVLREVLDELIAESRWGGIPMLLNRNPTLGRGSIRRLRITRVKDDVTDPTITMSILIVRGFNADFDGDALNAVLLLDDQMVEYMDGLLPHKSAFTFDRPFAVSSDLDLPKPTVAMLNNWGNHSTKRLSSTEDKRRQMQRYAA